MTRSGVEQDPTLPALDAAPPTPTASSAKVAPASRSSAAGQELSFRAVEPGDRLGRYEILERIGEGGMATVFRAKDLELRREVALKVLFPHLSRRAEVVARFQREARAAARLLHPAILQIFDVGGGEQGEPPFLVMELVRGMALSEHLAKHGPLLAEVAAAAGLRIAEALIEAHDAGVIHRDLKPANLLVSEDGRLLLADFGVARVDRDDSLATRTGAVLGTPAYMSPEQAVGEHIDVRSDLYSLGATLYHLATGVVAYSGPTMKILSQLANPGALVAPEKRRPAIGRELSSIILRLMAHDPAQRPRDAREAAALLRPVAATLGDVSAELAAYWRDPRTYVDGKLPTIVDRLVHAAKEQRDRGKLAAAMALADRAHALAPDDEAVATIVEEVTRPRPAQARRRWAAAAATVAALGLGALAMRSWRDEAVREAPPSASGPVPSAGGPVPSASGPVPSASGPVPSAGGPVPSAGGPVPSAGGPSPSAAPAVPNATPRLAAASSHPLAPSGPTAASPAEPAASDRARKRPKDSAATALATPTPNQPEPAIPTESIGEPPIEPPAAPAPAKGDVTFVMDAWCELTIDGVGYGRADRSRAIPLDPGSHVAECSQGAGLGKWRGEVVVRSGEASRVIGQVRVDVVVRVDVSGTAVFVDGQAVRNGTEAKVPNGRHRVSVRQGDREAAAGWVSIPRVSRCVLRDRPLLDCYPES